MFELVAQQGNPERVLFRTKASDEPAEEEGRIFDRRQGVLFPPLPLQSILARGYWTDYTGTSEERKQIEREARRADSP